MNTNKKVFKMKSSSLYSLFFATLMGFSSMAVSRPYSGTSCHDFCKLGKFTIGGEYLYWKAEQDALALGAHVHIEQEGAIVDSQIINPDFNYESGFRVYGDYMIPGSDWQIGIFYTHTPSSGSVSQSADIENNNFIALNTQNYPLLTAFAQAANSDELAFSSLTSTWTNHIDYLDVEVARTFCIDTCLTFTPHIGVRNFWMQQKIKATLTGEQRTPTVQEVLAEVNFKQRFYGVGVEGGLWGDWTLGCGFSMVGHMGGSILCSKFTMDQKAEEISSADLSSLSASGVFHTGTPMVDYAFGLAYNDCVFGMDVNVHANFEQHMLIDANRQANGGNLILSGLTIGGSITY